ncbi:hypothetical protein F5X96DRAFT_621759 [Biscogniauxia mediterranea]|nr:hypothetical protein F5X96DRAFT_621759 [Biscogniauxia mediterranea]
MSYLYAMLCYALVFLILELSRPVRRRLPRYPIIINNIIVVVLLSGFLPIRPLYPETPIGG